MKIIYDFYSLKTEEFNPLLVDTNTLKIINDPYYWFIPEFGDTMFYNKISMDSNERRNGMMFKRSVFAVKDIKAGEKLTKENCKVIRPSYGMHPAFYDQAIGRKYKVNIKRGQPIKYNSVEWK